MKNKLIFNFEEIKLDFKKKYRGKIADVRVVEGEYGTHRLQVWVVLDALEEGSNRFMLSMNITHVRPSQFYRFCYDMGMLKSLNQSLDLRTDLIGKIVDVKLVEAENGNIFINRIFPTEEKNNVLKKNRMKKIVSKEYVDKQQDEFEDESDEDFDLDEEFEGSAEETEEEELEDGYSDDDESDEWEEEDSEYDNEDEEEEDDE